MHFVHPQISHDLDKKCIQKHPIKCAAYLEPGIALLADFFLTTSNSDPMDSPA